MRVRSILHFIFSKRSIDKCGNMAVQAFDCNLRESRLESSMPSYHDQPSYRQRLPGQGKRKGLEPNDIKSTQRSVTFCCCLRIRYLV
ncbi:hypothetical protein BDV97DRAFT_218046 [Delphinella strobiligena]|nr:hypothetical protein BDV97DRAFT_218046 [Delphinella strobiligena]